MKKALTRESVLYVLKNNGVADAEIKAMSPKEARARAQAFVDKFSLSPGQLQIGVRGLKRPLVSRSLPLWHPDAPRHAPTGEAVFTSDAEVRQFCRKAGYQYGETTGRKG